MIFRLNREVENIAIRFKIIKYITIFFLNKITDIANMSKSMLIDYIVNIGLSLITYKSILVIEVYH